MDNQSSQYPWRESSGDKPLITEEEITEKVEPTQTETQSSKTIPLVKTVQDQKISFGQKSKNFLESIFTNKTSRAILIAFIVILVGASSSYAYYNYQKKQIYKKLTQESDQTLSEEAKSKLPEIAENKSEETQTTEPSKTQETNTGSSTASNSTGSSSSPSASSGSSSSGSSSNSNTTPQPTTTSTKTINNQAKELKKISTQNCYAYAPDGWTNVENMQSVGFGYDAYNSDQTLMASYGMVGVPGDQAYFYGYTSAEVFIQALYASIGYTGFSWQGETYDVGDGYKTRTFQATANGKSLTAMDLYKTWDIGGGGFILAQRVGTTYSDKWAADSATAFNVVLSMRCTAQLQQSSGTSSSTSNDSISDMISSSYENRQASLDKTSTQWSEAMRGVDNVYSPSTGQHYEAPYSAYSSTGPQGAGYYRSIDSVGGMEKLERGFGY